MKPLFEPHFTHSFVMTSYLVSDIEPIFYFEGNPKLHGEKKKCPPSSSLYPCKCKVKSSGYDITCHEISLKQIEHSADVLKREMKPPAQVCDNRKLFLIFFTKLFRIFFTKLFLMFYFWYHRHSITDTLYSDWVF